MIIFLQIMLVFKRIWVVYSVLFLWIATPVWFVMSVLFSPLLPMTAWQLFIEGSRDLGIADAWVFSLIKRELGIKGRNL